MRGKDISDCLDPERKNARTDPVRDDILGQGKKPDLDEIRALFPPPAGEAAFHEDVINSNIERLETDPEIDTGHPFLDLSVKTGLAFIDATFQGDHPKYGVKGYGKSYSDGFPPTIIAAVDALSAWGLNARAAQIFRYWLVNLVRDDGTIEYRGTSISELGQLLHTAALLHERAGPDGWCTDGQPKLRNIVEWLLARRREAEAGDGLLVGVPEDDQRKTPGKYFHNNAWAARGLQRWARLCTGQGSSSDLADNAHEAGLAIEQDTLEAIRKHWPEDPDDWWLPPKVEPTQRPEFVTQTTDSSYTNYRYWPELLSSGILPRDMAERVVNARLTAGGQFCGMTRFADWLDDWPLVNYLYSLWDLGMKDDFLLSLYGHVAYHQAEGHLTAYEQVTFPPGKEKAPYCLPCQLVAARAGRLLVNEHNT